MNNYYFYYSKKAYKLLKSDMPINPGVLATLAHDFQASLNRKVEAKVQITSEAHQREINARKTAEYSHKAFKKTGLWSPERDETIKQLLASRQPNWASVTLTVTKGGL